jgi:site-specific DNA-methyltransferase (adenine-specific)
MAVKLIHGDSLEVLKKMKDNRIDALITDPPYGISFMNKKWDYQIPPVELWEEVYRVMKPGAYGLVACGTRTQHRMAVNLEDAGFIIRDIVAWVYGQGFPKSHDVSKAIERKLTTGSSNTKDFGKLSGEKLERGGWGISKMNKTHGYRGKDYTHETKQTNRLGKLEPTTEEAKKWMGWGTALKPAMEMWTLIMKPISEKTIAENLLEWEVGAINIDACRVPSEPIPVNKLEEWSGFGQKERPDYEQEMNTQGRWPANLLHDGSEEVVELFPETKSGKMTSKHTRHTDGSPVGIYGKFDVNHPLSETIGDSGSAARFFYCAKASKSEKDAGLNELPDRVVGGLQCPVDQSMLTGSGNVRNNIRKNTHTTVKPIELMKYLVTLITPPGGKVLDPFMGSGTTGIACGKLGFNFIGIDLEEEYVEIAKKRIEYHTKESEDEV